MLKNFIHSHYETEVHYELTFWNNAQGGGSCFPCDKDGNLIKKEMTECGYKNYEYCMSHPEEFDIFNKVERIERSYKEPANGDCHCGEKVFLYNAYMGACQCPKCGQWYNLFGEELLPPEEWEEDY